MDADYSLRSTGPSKKRQRHSNRTPKPKKNYEYEEEDDDDEFLSDDEVSGAPRRSLRRRRTHNKTYEDANYDELSETNKKRRIAVKAFRESKYLCGLLIVNLLKHKNAWPFLNPVDPVALRLPNYNERIKHPMDLGTVQKKLEVGSYMDSNDFASDVRLTFDNCRLYNDLQSEIVRMANEVQKSFEEQFAEVLQRESKIIDNYEIAEMKVVIDELQAEYDKLQTELQRLLKGPASPNDTPTPPPVQQAKVKTKRGRKSKASSIPEPKRPVEFDCDMKELLSQKISSLSLDNLEKMVSFLSTAPELSAADSSSQGAEYELDLEKMSNITLSNLDDFVNQRLTEQTGGSNTTSSKRKNGHSHQADSDSSSSSESESEQEDVQDV